MTANANDSIPARRTWFPGGWLLGEPAETIRSTPVIELLDDLLLILRNEHISAQEVYISVRRAARLLSAFVAETDRGRRSSWMK